MCSSDLALMVNGQVVNIPSYQVKAGDVIALREKSKNQLRVTEALKLAQSIGMADWVQQMKDAAHPHALLLDNACR